MNKVINVFHPQSTHIGSNNINISYLRNHRNFYANLFVNYTGFITFSFLSFFTPREIH